MEGAVDDSSIVFSTTPEQSFTIRFYQKKFKGYDGRFVITGTSPDTNSAYHTSTPYIGFYKLYDDNRIGMSWFKNISWSMDFHRHDMGAHIGQLFRFVGTYRFTGSTLAFYSEKPGKTQPQIRLQTCDLQPIQMEYPLEHY